MQEGSRNSVDYLGFLITAAFSLMVSEKPTKKKLNTEKIYKRSPGGHKTTQRKTDKKL